ncbi:MAG: hypothetical protein BWY95_00717 [Bacteroidetes bacterium ADurb.BinA104]|nr:MAG: hypothetical protein BWY95_00717 [Bacteroidetes bacterium ADurb.BinA104]
MMNSNTTLLPGERRLVSSDIATLPSYSGFLLIGFSRLSVKDVIGVSIEHLMLPESRYRSISNMYSWMSSFCAYGVRKQPTIPKPESDFSSRLLRPVSFFGLMYTVSCQTGAEKSPLKRLLGVPYSRPPVIKNNCPSVLGN